LLPVSSLAGEWHIPWRVGQWAAYQIEDPWGDHRLVELFIVGRRRIDGTTFFWCELRGVENRTDVIVKQLISKDRQMIRDVLVQRKGHAPIALRNGSRVSLDGGEGWHTFFKWPFAGKRVREKLMVFAGTFRANRYQSGEGRFWFARKVPILGLVRAETKKLGKMVLMAYGYHGAVSALQGIPVILPRPGIGSVGEK